jgi:hypothetical protein
LNGNEGELFYSKVLAPTNATEIKKKIGKYLFKIDENGKL